MTYAADFVELMKEGQFKFGAAFDGDGVNTERFLLINYFIDIKPFVSKMLNLYFKYETKIKPNTAMFF